MAFWTRNLNDEFGMLCYYNLHTNVSECVPIVKMHYVKHGGGTCGDSWV